MLTSAHCIGCVKHVVIVCNRSTNCHPLPPHEALIWSRCTVNHADHAVTTQIERPCHVECFRNAGNERVGHNTKHSIDFKPTKHYHPAAKEQSGRDFHGLLARANQKTYRFLCCSAKRPVLCTFPHLADAVSIVGFPKAQESSSGRVKR